MKQCPHCNRDYSDDALSFCLEDGTRLVAKYDGEATMINPYPPMQQVVPPTVAFDARPVTPPAFSQPTPATETKTTRRRSPWLVGALVVLALGVGLTIGGFIFQRSNGSTSGSSSVDPSLEPGPKNAETPAPTRLSAAPTPTPSPSSATTTTAGNSTSGQNTACVLYNDKNDKSVIRVRMDCDTRNCETDASTIAGEYPDNTPVQVVRGSSVQGTRFTWIKVIILSSGQNVWVASSKIKCT